MNIAIIELIPDGHYTLVESVASIYLSDKSNAVTIITNQKGYDVLCHKISQKLNIIVIKNETETKDILGGLKVYDKIFMITFEPISKKSFVLMNIFLKSKIEVPIYFFIHNIDIWFNQRFIDKIKNIFFKLDSFNVFIYRIKLYFYYYQINKKIVSKVLNSGGAFATISNAVSNELAKFISPSRIVTIPFSCFDESLMKLDDKDSKDKITICIPGFVSNHRRDYFSVLKMFSNDSDSFIKNNFKFDFAGGLPLHEDITVLKREITKWKAEGYEIIIHETDYLKLVEFDECLQQSDLILGNLHIKVGLFGEYGKTKESGLAFTMIKAGKVGLIPSNYKIDDRLLSSTINFESYDDLIPILKKIRQIGRAHV